MLKKAINLLKSFYCFFAGHSGLFAAARLRMPHAQVNFRLGVAGSDNVADLDVCERCGYLYSTWVRDLPAVAPIKPMILNQNPKDCIIIEKGGGL